MKLPFHIIQLLKRKSLPDLRLFSDCARGDTYPDRHPARLDNLKFSAFFPKRANVIVASYSPRAAHSVLIPLCSLLLITGYLLQHDDIISLDVLKSGAKVRRNFEICKETGGAGQNLIFNPLSVSGLFSR